MTTRNGFWDTVTRVLRRARNQRGESALQVLIGAVIITMLVGGFTTFWINSNRQSQDTASRTQQESAGVQILNRITRDVEDASRVLEANPNELVLEKTEPGGTSAQRTYYRVSGTAPNLTLDTKVQKGVALNAAYDPNASWTPDSTIGRKITSNTRFDYVDRAGATTSTPTDVGRVDITYAAIAAKGTISLKSSAAVRAANGGGGGGNVVIVTGPTALPDSATVTKGTSTTINVLDGSAGGADTCNGSTTSCTPPVTGLTVSGQPSGLTTTVNPSTGTVQITVASGYSGSTPVTLTYTLTDNTGLPAATATITVTITNPVATPTPSPVGDTVNLVRGGSAVTLDLWANDIGVGAGAPNNSTNALGAAPSGVSVTANGNGSVTFQAQAGYSTPSGQSSMTYTVTNTGGTGPISASATVTIKVIDAVNDSASIVRSTGSAGSTNIDIIGNDIPTSASALAANGATLTPAATSSPAGLTGISWSSGLLFVTAPAGLADGTYTVTYTLSQPSTGAGSSPTVTDTGTVTITVSTTTSTGPTPLVAHAYPSQVMSRATITGQNTITWNATTGPYTVKYRSTPGSGTWNTFTDADGSNTNTSATQTSIQLGTKYEYQVTDSQGTPQVATDTSLQFPGSVTWSVYGSDQNFDGAVDYQGTAVVFFAALDSTKYSGIAYSADRYSSYKDGLGAGQVTATPEASTANPPTSTTGACSGAGVVLCAALTGRPAASEDIYQMAAYATCDPDVPAGSVTRVMSGVNQCGTPESYGPPVSYTAALKAYQAPTAVPAAFTAGDATAATSCPASGTNAVGLTINLGDVPATATNGFYNCVTNDAKAAYTTDPDVSEASTGQFCDYSNNSGTGVCAARLGKGDNNSSFPTLSTLLSNSPRAFTSASSNISAGAWGANNLWAVSGCNLGGCGSSLKYISVLSFPGAFTVNTFNMPSIQTDSSGNVSTQNRRGNYSKFWENPGCWTAAGCTTEANDPQFTFGWTNSAGADVYNDYANVTGGAAAGRTARDFSDSNVVQTGSGYHSTYDASKYRVKAFAFNDKGTTGLQRVRLAQADIFTAPPANTLLEDTPFCRPADDNNFKYGAAYRFQAWDDQGNTVHAWVSGFRGFVWGSKVGISDSLNKIGYKAAADWGQPDQMSWPAPSTWTTSTRVWNYFTNTNSGAWGATAFRAMLGGTGNDDQTIPGYNAGDSFVGAGHVRIESYTSNSLAGNPDFGDLTNFNNANYSGNYGSDEMRARGLVLKSVIATCQGNGTTGNNFLVTNGTAQTNWWAVSNGAQITRRAHKSLTGVDTPANQAWSAVPGV